MNEEKADVNENKNISCEVTKDLIPLYIDQVCSEHSKKLVEQHIEDCDECRSILTLIKEELGHQTIQPLTDEKNDSKIIKGLAHAWKKTKIKSWLKGVLATIISFGLLIFSYIGLTQWYIIPVTVDDIDSINVYQLSDGSIAYRLNEKGGYYIHYITMAYNAEDKEGYILGLRPIIKDKKQDWLGEENKYNFITRNLEEISRINIHNEGVLSSMKKEAAITKWHYGSKDNSILIWQEGMHIPNASAELEEYWKHHNFPSIKFVQ